MSVSYENLDEYLYDHRNLNYNINSKELPTPGKPKKGVQKVISKEFSSRFFDVTFAKYRFPKTMEIKSAFVYELRDNITETDFLNFIAGFFSIPPHR